MNLSTIAKAMVKRRRNETTTPSPSQTRDTPSKRTRRQTQPTIGAEPHDVTLHRQEEVGRVSPQLNRRRRKANSLHISTDTIVNSPEAIVSSAEHSPDVSGEGLHVPSGASQSDDQAIAQNATPFRDVATTILDIGVPSQYVPPKRPVPANPRRPMTPVPGATPKAALGIRLRQAAERVNLHNFKYEPIRADQVRLMKLERGSPQDRIKVALLTVPYHNLGSGHRFEALSYHWGEDDAAKPLYIRDLSRAPPTTAGLIQDIDHLRRREKRVKYNLYEALYHLRKPDKDIWMWVDALCIDQENPKEKEIQVARIADIYIAADTVLIWLGQGNEHTKQAIKLLKDLADEEQQTKIISDKTRLTVWKDLAHLMKASWFSRRWVIQELALAKNAVIYCGSDSIHWVDLRDGISVFVQSEDLIRARFHKSKDFNHDYHALEETEPLAAKMLIEKVGDVFRKNPKADNFVATEGLESLTSSLFAFNTSDPRDTINGLINISKEGIGLRDRVKAQVEARSESMRQSTINLDEVNSSHIAQVLHLGTEPPPPPSYQKDLLDVYVDFLKWIVQTTGTINMLCRHWAIPERTRLVSGYPELVKLPSWIKLTTDGPFRHTEKGWYRQNADCLVGLPNESPYNACHRFSQADIRFSTHEASDLAASRPFPVDLRKSASAKVKGLRLGTIDDCTDPMSGGNITLYALDMLGWRSQSPSSDIEELKDYIWRPLVADRGPDGKNPPPLWRKCCKDILINHTDHGSINIDMITPKIKLPHTKSFLKRVRQVTWNRRILEVNLDPVFKKASRNDNHSTGLGPYNVRPSDIVCILYGCSVPCILRPRPNILQPPPDNDDSGLAYDFVGEAYVYGFMGGEAITMLDESERQSQEQYFTLL